MRTIQEDCNQLNQPRTKSFVVTAFRPETNTTTLGAELQEVSSTLRTFFPHKKSEKSRHDEDVRMSVIHQTTTAEEENRNVVNMEEVGAIRAIREITQTRKIQEPPTENYLQPVNNKNLQGEIKIAGSSRLCQERSQKLPSNHPQPKPRVKTLGKRETEKLSQCKHSTINRTPLSLQSTDMLEPNPLYHTEAAQHCASVKPSDQSNRDLPQTISRHEHQNENELCTTTSSQNALRPPGRVESPYTRVLSNTNWEVSRDHLSLFERIGGGSFGQVWKGAALDVAGAKGWSIVAVKMLKGKGIFREIRKKLENWLCQIFAAGLQFSTRFFDIPCRKFVICRSQGSVV